MARPKRSLLATVEQTSSPPPQLSENQAVGRIVKGAGNNLYDVQLPSRTGVLVEMPSRFRSTIWVKRGTYVVIDRTALSDRDNKLGGEIVNIVRDEKQWKKQDYWPKEFAGKAVSRGDADEDDSIVGKMPPVSDDES